MKKLVAISVIFALVAGAAFADSRIGGSLEMRWNIVDLDLAEDELIARTGGNGTSGLGAGGVFQLSGSDDDGYIRGLFKTTWSGYSGLGTADADGTWIESAWIAWQPHDLVEFFIGRDGDGKFQNSNLTRWAFHKMPRGIAEERWDGHSYILGGWDGGGVALSIIAHDMVTIHTALNVMGGAARDAFSGSGPTLMRWEDIWEEGFQIGADINLPIGKINVTYRAMEHWPTQGSKMVGASYGGSPVSGIELEIGGNYRLDDDANPIRAALGFFYTGDNFGVKSRFFYRHTDPTENMWIEGEIMPWYKIDWCEIRLSARITKDGDKDIGWHVNPYISKDFSAGQFRIGVMFEDHNGDGDMTFKLPMALLITF